MSRLAARFLLASLTSVALAVMCGCSLHRSAGSMTISPGTPLLLRIRAPEPTELDIEVWNRGPADVRFEQVQPGTNEFAKGVLRGGGHEFRWTALTRHLELSLETTGEATVAYTVRSKAGVRVEMTRKP